jgi:hypothetical protein
MSDATWGVMLLTAALWVVGPVWRWRYIRRRARLIPRLWRSLHRAPQPAKTAEINAGLEQVEQPARHV